MQQHDRPEDVPRRPDPRTGPSGAEPALDALAGDTVELAAAAAAAATAADRRRVHAFVAALAPRARPRARWWLAAAAALAAAALWWRPGPAAADGVLGGAAPVAVEHDGVAVRVRMREQLPPGESYHLRLEPVPGQPLSAVSDAAEWTFPTAWTEALATATSAHLIVQVGDRGGLAIVHRVRLK